MILYSRTLVQAAVFLFLCLFTSAAWGASSIGVTVEEAYPDLAGGILRKARIEKLPKGIVLQTKEIQIDEKFLQKTIQKVDPEQRSQYEKNLFFFLEQEIVNEIILHEARRAGAKPNSSDEEVIQKYLDEKVSGVKVTQQEMEEFYKENKDSFGGVSFENVKDDLHRYLLEEKRSEAIRSYKRTVGEGWDILVDAEWTEKQNLLSKDNFVDKARLSGKPTMVEFGAHRLRPLRHDAAHPGKPQKKISGQAEYCIRQRGRGTRFWVPDMVLSRFLCKLSLIRPAGRCSDTLGSTRRLR